MASGTNWVIAGIAALAAGIGGVIWWTKKSKAAPPPPPTQGTLILNVTSGAVFSIGGDVLQNGSYSLDPGTYSWSCSKTGYVTQTGSMTIAAGEIKNLTITLVAAPTDGAVVLNLNPNDATFTIGGVVWTPGSHAIGAGIYTWSCSKSGYTTQTGSVTVSAGQNITLTVTLVAIVTDGTLALTLNPSDAVFSIGGIQWPAGNHAIAAGTYDWLCTKVGYVSQNGSITVVAGQTVSKAITLVAAPTDGTLVLNLNPSNSIFTIGDVQWTPGSHTIAAGTYDWSCSKSGYVSQNGNITIVVGQTVTKTITLVAVPAGTLVLNLNPSGVIFSIGGVQWPAGSHPVAAGTYDWSCTKSGYISQNGSIVVPPDHTVTLTITLIPVGTSLSSKIQVGDMLILGTTGIYYVIQSVYKAGTVINGSSFSEDGFIAKQYGLGNNGTVVFISNSTIDNDPRFYIN